jgi:hypothetical protein
MSGYRPKNFSKKATKASVRQRTALPPPHSRKKSSEKSRPTAQKSIATQKTKKPLKKSSKNVKTIILIRIS